MSRKVFVAGSGSGGGDTYDGPFLLDAQSFDLTAQGASLDITNLNSYAQGIRIRGLDDATKAYAGFNCMTANGTGGNMRHSFTLVSANQATGAISLENVRTIHNNTGSTNDYSTFVKTSDEWTGRYTYQGHIPCNGTSHAYSYHQVYIYGTGTSQFASNHTSRATYYPGSNDITHSSYVAPSERRLGGAVKHVLGAYDASASKAHVLEYNYGYSTNTLNATTTDSKPFSTTLTSTNYQVPLNNQWDATSEPYYDAFHAFQEGLYARRRSTGAWSIIISGNQLSTGWAAFFLTSGKTVLRTPAGRAKLIDATGGMTDIPAANTAPTLGAAVFNYYAFCWNIGPDEWLQNLPAGEFLKFKLNPSTGYVTVSNVLKVADIAFRSYDQNYHSIQGLYSSFSPGNVNQSCWAATFGTENANGYGYGRSKLLFIGGSQAAKNITAATFDIAGLTSALSYA